jgi:Zn finger protein HypA/HybF involved in hydrogenase expression
MVRKRIGAVWVVEREELQDILNTSDSLSDVLKKLGYVSITANIKTLHKRIQEDELDLDILKSNRRNARKEQLKKLRVTKMTPDADLFVQNSPTSRSVVKKRIEANKYIPYECSKCGVGDMWENSPLVLQLEHVNGANNDHRLENLTFLCPNCHSQTDTFAGKNALKKKCALCNKRTKYGPICTRCSKQNSIITSNILEKDIVLPRSRCVDCDSEITYSSKRCIECSQVDRRIVDRPDKETLLSDVKKLGFSGTGRKYCVSDNAIRKWCKSYNLPTTKKEIKILNIN